MTNGLARPASNPDGDGSWVKCKDDGALLYDVEKAKALIKDYGKPVDFKMVFTARLHADGSNGQVLQQFWKQIGANMEIEQIDQASFPPRAFMRQFQIIGWRIIHLADPDPQMYANFHTGKPFFPPTIPTPSWTICWSTPALLPMSQPAYRGLLRDQPADLLVLAIWFWTFQNTYYAISTSKLKGLPKMDSGVVDVSRTWKE